MRSGGLLAIVAGCGFQSPAGSLQPPVDADDASTIPPDDGGPAGTGTTFCEPIPGVVACYDFEGNAFDSSGHDLDASTVDVNFVPGHLGSAMQFGATSSAGVGDSTFLDVRAITIEAWIDPSQLPAPGNQSDILDVDNQYAFFINPDGTLTCDLHGVGTFKSTGAVPIDRWTHVACAYGGIAAQIYIDGSHAGELVGSGTLGKGNNPMTIGASSASGAHLIGLIDELRLMSVARAGADICADAGQTSCQ